MFDGVPVGPLRIWLADVNIPGLSMTRSFGDKVAATVGIIADPEIVERELHPQDRYLILCSDGIHEFLENEQIISMVHTRAESGAQPHEICAHMVSIPIVIITLTEVFLGGNAILRDREMERGEGNT